MADRIQSLDSSSGVIWEAGPGPVDPIREAAGGDGADGAKWQEVSVPANLIEELPGLTGDETGREYWYRLRFELNDFADESLSIRLGIVNDSDRVYLNGKMIGGYGAFDSDRAQAYDRVRIYELPGALLRADRPNVLHVHVRGYFPGELGIFKDRTALGPSRIVWHDFYRENTVRVLILSFYLAVGGYFLFLFFRRRQEFENFYFGLVIVLLVVYQFLVTQYKFELNLSFTTLKKIEYLSLQVLVPLFYQFVRSYFTLRGQRITVWLDRFTLVLHSGVAVAWLTIAFTDSPRLWNTINTTFSQPVWILYLIATFAIITRKMIRRDTDALIMGGGLLFLTALMGIDVGTARGYFNLPPLIPYGFILFILGFALILANRFVRLHNEADRLNIELEGQSRAFRRFVPGQFLELLGKNEVSEIGLGDSAFLEMSVLFSDLRSFTSLSEKMRPEDNFKFLNSYLQRMEPGIQNHGGFVDKFVGDAIMALFPEENGKRIEASSTSESSADRAAAAAAEMRSILRDYNRHRRNHDYPPIDFGIGINSGSLMLGTVGSAERLDTTVIGDSVNLASRIEGLTSVYHVGVILSEQARLGMRREDWMLREIDTIIVKGRHEPIIIFELFNSDDEEARQIKGETRDRFEGGVALYKAGEFVAALEIFEALYRRSPEDRVVQLYIKRCRKLRDEPPGPGWRGAVRVRFK